MGLVVSVLLLALLGLALELVGAWWAPPVRGNLVPHWRFNHTWIPGGTWVASAWARHNPEYPRPYTQTYNSQGWLETYDVAKHKPPGTYRIFYMGDSFTEGTPCSAARRCFYIPTRGSTT